MIKILTENQLDEINIIGLIELGCKACKDAMKEGKGNPELCKTCKKNEIQFFKMESNKI